MLIVNPDNSALNALVASAKFANVGAIEFGIPMLDVPDISVPAGKLMTRMPGDIGNANDFTAQVYVESGKDWTTLKGEKATIDIVRPNGSKYSGKGFVTNVSFSEVTGNAWQMATLTMAWAGGTESPTYGAGA